MTTVLMSGSCVSPAKCHSRADSAPHLLITYVGGSRQVDERTKLADALAEHLRMRSGQAQKHALLRKYVEAGPQQLTLLLKQENSRPVSDSRCNRCKMMLSTYRDDPCCCCFLISKICRVRMFSRAGQRAWYGRYFPE